MLSNPLQKLSLTPSIVHAIGGAVFAALACTFYFAFYAPAAADMAHRESRMDQIHLLMGASDKVAREFHELHDRVAQLERASASARKRMPRRPATQEFIETISGLAAASGVQVKLCSSAAPQSFPTHTQVEVSCDLIGSFAGVCRFLADVDGLSQISKLSVLSIDTTEKTDEYPVSVKFQLYYRAQHNDTEME